MTKRKKIFDEFNNANTSFEELAAAMKGIGNLADAKAMADQWG